MLIIVYSETAHNYIWSTIAISANTNIGVHYKKMKTFIIILKSRQVYLPHEGLPRFYGIRVGYAFSSMLALWASMVILQACPH